METRDKVYGFFGNVFFIKLVLAIGILGVDCYGVITLNETEFLLLVFAALGCGFLTYIFYDYASN